MVYAGNFRRQHEAKFINQVKIEPDTVKPKRAISSAAKSTQKIKLQVHKPGGQKMKPVEMKVTKKNPSDNRQLVETPAPASPAPQMKEEKKNLIKIPSPPTSVVSATGRSLITS